MFKLFGRLILLLIFFCCFTRAYSQQDVDFHLSSHLFTGKKILKVKRDYHDPYLWVLAQNNQVYRVNSLTLAIDDYTATFAAYNNLQFVDIAGRSQDTVFIATNSSSFITFKKGALSTVGAANGISGTINQIGMDYKYANPNYNYGDPSAGKQYLLIATTANNYKYDTDLSQVQVFNTGAGNNTLFETTYRSELYSNLSFSDYYDPASPTDPTKTLPVAWQTPYTEYGGNLWYNNPIYGYHIYTAYFINPSYDGLPYSGYAESIYMNELCGTENGLTETNWNNSYFLSSAYKHYLNGIKVNKITSIYGLISFPNMMRENVLVGTDNGLYFTNSAYQNHATSSLNDYNTFTLDSEIGNQPIIDICVDATSYLPIICEDAAWVATNNGLYLIKPDYNNYLGVTQIKAISFKNQPDTLSTINICASDSAVALINTNVYNGQNIQWYKDGNELPAQSKSSLTIKTAGDYNAVLYDPCADVHLESNHIKVNVISSPVFTFDYPDKIQQCNSNPETLNVTYSSSYHYRWYQDGVLNVDTTASLTVTQSGKYYVEVSACTNSWIPSKIVEIDLIMLPQPSITSDKTTYCASDNAILSANVATDASYTINWYKDNILLTDDANLATITANITGSYTATINSNIASCTQSSAAFQLNFTPTPTFTFNYPDELDYCTGTTATLNVTGSPDYQYRWYKNGVLNDVTTASISLTQSGTYKAEVSACANSWVPSKEVQVNFIQLPIPIITPDKPGYCLGDQATMTLSTAADPTYTISWLRDGAVVDSYQDMTSVTTSIPGSYTAMLSSKALSACTQTSAPVQIQFDQPPTISIKQIVNTTLCAGQTIGLQAIHSSGTVNWSTGESGDQISVSNPGTYTATVTTPIGCTADAGTSVQFLPGPVLALHDTTMCEFSRQIVTLTAPSGFNNYSWNGQQTGNTYKVSTPQTITLIVTDVNGCQATQKIVVASQCPSIMIANAFTPNGDGINDTWTISGLDNDPSVAVKVYNRYGIQVYQNKGYSTSWDGKYNGRKLPTGVYYYVINAKNGKENFSGSLTIIY